MRRFTFIVPLITLLTFVWSNPAVTQSAEKPLEKALIFPVATAPGANTWLTGQPYGNTVGAFNFGSAWYATGQGLHFGVDISMPCGTPLVAVADGEVTFVDNLNFGSGPHNLLLRHDSAGITTLYGHLLNAAPVFIGQQVKQGEVIAYSG
ncbi:MAG TPA: M23 family metallopeptidase, partial [Phototrophicaceae bacterium]|nr:M23 family metallopeptidase [Phototrophicaceae bacterium]